MTKTLNQTRNAGAAGKSWITVTCPSFGNMELIPRQYTHDGADINPQLDIGEVPASTRSLAVLVHDEDRRQYHQVQWAVWNIPIAHTIREARATGQQGVNDYHRVGYNGPCPPYGTHRYAYKVYALDSLLDLPANADGRQLEKAMAGHILGYGDLWGLYRRY